MRAAGLEEYVQEATVKGEALSQGVTLSTLSAYRYLPVPSLCPCPTGFFMPRPPICPHPFCLFLNSFTLSSRHAGVDAAHQNLKGIGLYAHH